LSGFAFVLTVVSAYKAFCQRPGQPWPKAKYAEDCNTLSPTKTKLGFVYQIRAQDGDILLEARQHRLADAKRLNRFLVSTG
jgi:hypothetical protein